MLGDIKSSYHEQSTVLQSNQTGVFSLISQQEQVERLQQILSLSEQVQRLENKKCSIIRKHYRGLTMLSNPEIKVYCELYRQSSLEKEVTSGILAVCGQTIICVTFLFFNSWNTRFLASSDDDMINGPVRTCITTFLAGASAAITIIFARPLVNMIGKADEINLYDPVTLLNCFIAGCVSVSGVC